MTALGFSAGAEAPTVAPASTSAPGDQAPSILVGIDVAAPSRAVARVVSAIRCARHATVRVLTVVSPTPSVDARQQAKGADRDGARRRAVTFALASACPAAATWPVVVKSGDVVATLTQTVSELGAELLVIGLPDPNRDANLRDNVVRRVLRRLRVPVFAVAATATRQPRVIVAAVDFTRSSLHAARAALGIIAPGGTLHLVHVQPEFGNNGSDGEGLRAVYMQGIGGAFDRLLAELSPPDDVAVRTTLLEGFPYETIARFATDVGADAVALGSHRLESTMVNIGRVPTAFLRDGTWSVLIAPPKPHADPVGVSD